MKLLRYLASIAAIALVAACSSNDKDAGTLPWGGGDQGGGGTPAVTAANLIVDTSATQLPNTPTSSVTITVTAISASNVVVPGAAVSLSADNDGVITQSSSTTDSSGKVTGTLSIGGNRANRLITVTATSGDVSGP